MSQPCPLCGFNNESDVNLLTAKEPVYDLATLNRVHHVWEFLAQSDRQFDTWLHAQVERAEKAAEKGRTR